MSAEGMRILRADRKLGLKTLRGCKVDEVGLTELLIAHELLTEAEAEDWLAVGNATARLLESFQLAHLRNIR
jgi:hypothetical protein